MNDFDDLLDAFAHTFYGYGNYEGAYWFIGMEEGGGSFDQDVVNRLSVWDRHERPELEDAALFHREIKYGYCYFEKQPNRRNTPTLQRTWNKLIRILLSAEGVLIDKDDDAQRELVREYQRTSLGRAHGQNCLIELLPLPSRSTKPEDWMYAEHSALDYCANREVYKSHFMSIRADHIKKCIIQYKPKVVVFYCVDPEYLRWWKHIADSTFSYDNTYNIRIAAHESTLFVIAQHPVTKGITKTYFHNIGQKIAYERAKLLDSGKL